MDLNHNILKTILSIYDEMYRSGIKLVYLGEFSHGITKMFSTMGESEMVSKEENKKVRKRIYHIIVETLQNMNKHSDEISADENVGNGLFIIGRKADEYYIITSNRVLNDRKGGLESAIKQVNSATAEELKQMHKTQIREGKLSEKGGAGLGLIEIARKTNEKLQYQFIPIDVEFSFFILKVTINIKNI
jgi:hypothetical protein